MLFLLILFLFLASLSLFYGSADIPTREIWDVLIGNSSTDSFAYYIVWQSRLPASLTAILAGCSLSVAGLIMQTIFDNPLADPSILGVNSGAALGSAIALLLFQGLWNGIGLTLTGALLTIIFAFIGAMVVIFILTLLSHYLRDSLSLLIAGVMISFGVGAIISLLNFYATAESVRNFVVWGMGDFSSLSISDIPLFALLTIIPFLLLTLLSRPFNALMLGEDYAANLGISIRQVRTISLLLVGLLTATVTACCGPISFIGLAVPHIARLLFRSSDHRILLPATFLLGAIIALCSLLLTYLPGDGTTLPLAAITPLIGVPIVLYILIKRK